MRIDAADAYAAFLEAVHACDPARRVADALATPYPRPLATPRGPHPKSSDVRGARRRLAIAVGKAALAMARGAGPVDRGVAVAPADDRRGALPAGWTARWSAHPVPDERSVEAAAAVRDVVESATDEDVVIALISGGASALIEEPRVPLAELRAITGALMAGGAPIEDLNTVRGALSAIKAGQLAEACGARILTLVVSDIIGDPLALIGSGPTIGPWVDAPGAPVDVGANAEARREAAIAILERHGLAVPAVLHAPIAPRITTRADRATLVLPMHAFADAVREALVARGIYARRLDPPFAGDVRDVADRLAALQGPLVAWGEATLRVPADRGEGGRAQQLALELAKRFAHRPRTAYVVGSDGIDGPRPHRRPPPAGAAIDGTTWDALRAAGIDPDDALARCDAGGALAAIDALVVTGPTGVNHADVVILG